MKTTRPHTAAIVVAVMAGVGLAGLGATGIAFDIVGVVMAALAAVTGADEAVQLPLDWPMSAARAAALIVGTALLVSAVRRHRRARCACRRCGRPPVPTSTAGESRRTPTSTAGEGRRTWDRLTVGAGYATVVLAAGYGALKAQWGLGGTIGLDDPHAFGEVRLWSSGMGDTALLALIGMALGLGFARTWRPPLRMPRWLPLTAAFVGCVMLVPVGILGIGYRIATVLGIAQVSMNGVSLWVFDVIYAWFLIMGLAMGLAAVGYHYRTRGVCRSCGQGRPAFT
ncbi:hypothetical protein [Microtetraspora malaysiensis]|uniref:hypothetical protein n=1 Tax=Microtetraspora malaysiensis TaxID=161358 RepID=UPI003D92E759